MRIISILYLAILQIVAGTNPSSQEPGEKGVVSETKAADVPPVDTLNEVQLGKRSRDEEPLGHRNSADRPAPVRTDAARFAEHLESVEGSKFAYVKSIVNRERILPSAFRRFHGLLKHSIGVSRLEIEAFEQLETVIATGNGYQQGSTIPKIVMSGGTVDGSPIKDDKVDFWYKILSYNTSMRLLTAANKRENIVNFLSENIKVLRADNGVEYVELTDLAWDTFCFPMMIRTMKKSVTLANAQEPHLSPIPAGTGPHALPRAPPPFPMETVWMPGLTQTGSYAAGPRFARTSHASPFEYYDTLPEIAREYVHQFFATHGSGTVVELGRIIGNDRRENIQLLQKYFDSILVIGLIDLKAFDYLTADNARHCREGLLYRLTKSVNALFRYDESTLMNSDYNEARVAFWCREIIVKKDTKSLTEFRNSHKLIGINGLTLSINEYQSMLMPRLTTLYWGPTPISYEQVVAAIAK